MFIKSKIRKFESKKAMQPLYNLSVIAIKLYFILRKISIFIISVYQNRLINKYARKNLA